MPDRHSRGGIFRAFESADLGIDGALELLSDEREPSGDLVLLQIKAGTSYFRDGKCRLTSDRDHFESWARYSVPVVGIVCDPDTGEARWVDISKHLRRHPQRVSDGPYTIEIPAKQAFSVETFTAFAAWFRRATRPVTSVEVTPNLLIRDWHPRDAEPTLALLAAIALDYPGFDTWLQRKWNEPKASKKVVEVDGAIAAFSMWEPKDERNLKLQTFMVGPRFRGTGIGQHLLYHEIRTWAADAHIERAYVTVANNKADLISYFRNFGFRVEGVAANRYDRKNAAAELIMAKHLVRKTIRTPDELEEIVEKVSQRVWGVTSSQPRPFGLRSEDFAIPARVPDVWLELDRAISTVSPRMQLVDSEGHALIQHDDESLMRELYPLRLHLADKTYVIVPIYPRWAEAMLLERTPHTQLKLRIDNVYYCYPKLKRFAKGDHVIFYETKSGGGIGAARGSAVVQEVLIDRPETLYAKYAELGIYHLDDVKRHARQDGRAMAIKFALFEPFPTLVELARIRQLLGNQINVQGLTRISRNQFEAIRDQGLASP